MKTACKAIQLDAERSGYERGVRDAAAICVNQKEMQPITESEVATGIACNTATLSLLDNKETK